ncbi:hypothetical protein [Thermoleptolyngbya sp.]
MIALWVLSRGDRTPSFRKGRSHSEFPKRAIALWVLSKGDRTLGSLKGRSRSEFPQRAIALRFSRVA